MATIKSLLHHLETVNGGVPKKFPCNVYCDTTSKDGTVGNTAMRFDYKENEEVKSPNSTTVVATKNTFEYTETTNESNKVETYKIDEAHDGSTSNYWRIDQTERLSRTYVEEITPVEGFNSLKLRYDLHLSYADPAFIENSACSFMLTITNLDTDKVAEVIVNVETTPESGTTDDWYAKMLFNHFHLELREELVNKIFYQICTVKPTFDEYIAGFKFNVIETVRRTLKELAEVYCGYDNIHPDKFKITVIDRSEWMKS